MFIIDGMPSGLHERINMPNLKSLADEGVIFNEVYLPLPAHPEVSDEYPWTCSLPNPVLMSGTVFIGQEAIKQNLIQHSFSRRPTAFLVNAWSYFAISHGFTLYKDISNGKFENVFKDELVINAGKDIILETNPEFIRIHCQGPGSAGHRSHRESGQPYTENIWSPGSPFIIQNQFVDNLLGEFVRWLKDEDLWENTVIMVLGDHGQADKGGHPPHEPGGDVTQMVVAGAGIKKGVAYDYAEIIDVAPTIAWLHSVNIPKFSNGTILKEIMAGSISPCTCRRDKLLKELNKAQREILSLNIDNRSDLTFSIDQIGRWHTGKYKNDYKKFVSDQIIKY